MGIESEFVAVTIIDTTFDGVPGTFSNVKSIFKPLFSKAVMDGTPVRVKRWVSLSVQGKYFVKKLTKATGIVEICANTGEMTKQNNKEDGKMS